MLNVNIEDIRYELSQVVSYNVHDISAGHLFATYFAWRVLNMSGVDPEVRDVFEDMFAWLDAGNEVTAEQRANMRQFNVRGAEYPGDEVGYIED